MPVINLQLCPIDATYDPSVEPDLNWIWNGYLAPGDITLLTSQWKAGKTTLLTGLLRSLAGGVPFLDRPTRPAKVLLVSEESRSQWGERVRARPIGDHVRLLSRPFFGRPSLQEWKQLIAFAMAQYLDLFVIDPLATFLPGRNESDAATMLEALEPLRGLAGDDCAVLLLHHPKKKGGEIGSSARGSGALLGFVDTSLELRRPSHLAADSQCRTLYGQSRRSGTPARLAYEWNRAEGAFEVLPDPYERQFDESWRIIRAILTGDEGGLTHREIAASWPAELEKPNKVALYAWLATALDRGLAVREGRGTSNDPQRFKLCQECGSSANGT